MTHADQNRPYGIALFDDFIFYNDATREPNPRWISYIFENEDYNVDNVNANVAVYGITDNNLWLSYNGHMWSTKDKDNLPAFCMARISRSYPLLFHIKSMGIPCFPDPFAKQFSNDKKLTASLAASLGIETIDSVFGNYCIVPSFDRFEYPFIVKPSNSSEGKNIFKVDDNETLLNAEYKISHANGPENVIWQESMSTGDDLRVYMFGSQPYFAIMRKATSSFKANYDTNPEVTKMEIEEVEEMFPGITDKASLMMENMPGETGFCSADFLFDDKDGVRKPVLGETSMGNLGTKLVRERKPEFLEDYLSYIYEKIAQ